MKPEHFLVIFVIFLSVFFVRVNGNVKTLVKVDDRTKEYNRNVDRACDDAMTNMLEYADDYSTSLNLQSCQEDFFKSLYASFGVMDSPSGQEELQHYIPILLVTQNDGFYILKHTLAPDKATSIMQWTQKIPYTYTYTVTVRNGAQTGAYKVIVAYTMGDDVTIHYQGKSYTGAWNRLSSIYSFDSKFMNLYKVLSDSSSEYPILSNRNTFTSMRNSILQYVVTKKANYYVNKHNEIAKAFGINYHFAVPVSATDSFARTISDVTLMAIFQGYPLGKGTKEVYSRYSVSGAHLIKSTKYYVCKASNGYYYYHLADCEFVKRSAKITKYDSKQECASVGAYPCKYCNP